MVVTRGESTTARMECGLVDQYSLTTDETRTWTIGIPFSLNGSFQLRYKHGRHPVDRFEVWHLTIPLLSRLFKVKLLLR